MTAAEQVDKYRRNVKRYARQKRKCRSLAQFAACVRAEAEALRKLRRWTWIERHKN